MADRTKSNVCPGKDVCSTMADVELPVGMVEGREGCFIVHRFFIFGFKQYKKLFPFSYKWI